MNAEHDNSEMIGLCHVGMYARNPASLAEFYRDVATESHWTGSSVNDLFEFVFRIDSILQTIYQLNVHP